MIQLNRIQLTSQTPNHVEITKILSTSQRESSIVLLTASTKLEDWILINECQLFIDAKYTRDWQLGLKKKLQDSVVKPIIFTTHKNEVFR